MLDTAGCRARQQRLWSLVRQSQSPDALVLADPQSLTQLANVVADPLVFRSQDAQAVLVLLANGQSLLIADTMSGPFAERATGAVDEIITPVWYDGRHSAPHRLALLAESAATVLSRYQWGGVGVELGRLPAGVSEGLRCGGGLTLTGIDTAIRALRRAKDADEIAVLRRSMTAGEAAHAAVMAQVRPGMTELDAYLIAQAAAQRAIGGAAIVYGDFRCGPLIRQGGRATGRVMAAGELFLIDCSVVVDGYRGDFANTFVVGGQPASAAQQTAYEVCLAAMTVGEGHLRAAASCRAIDAACRAVFAQRGLAVYGHHTGHGIGLGHPEPPFVTALSDDTLAAGDVVTLEPGYYDDNPDGWGGMRYERNYLITEAGYERLSDHALALTPP